MRPFNRLEQISMCIRELPDLYNYNDNKTNFGTNKKYKFLIDTRGFVVYQDDNDMLGSPMSEKLFKMHFIDTIKNRNDKINSIIR